MLEIGPDTYRLRPYDLSKAGGPLQRLSAAGVQITKEGVDQVRKHIARFEPSPLNAQMMLRLQQIAEGQRASNQRDIYYYTHELREYQRYSNLGWESGQPAEAWEAYVLWNNTHTAALADYHISDADLPTLEWLQGVSR